MAPTVRNIKQSTDPYQRIPVFTIRAGKHAKHILQEGDWFRFYNLEGVYKFKYHVVTPSGSEYISAWGGSKDPNGVNSWRSFPLDAEFLPIKNQRKEKA